MTTRIKWTAILLSLVLAVLHPIAVMAASVELTASAKSSLDKIYGTSDRTTAGNIRSQYEELAALQRQEQEWEAKGKALHYSNEEALIALRRQIAQIDADLLKKLDADVKQTKKRYEPLFALYHSLNQQINAAKILKNKELNAMLRLQADSLKAAVALARQDIRSKEQALKTARAGATRKMKTIRTTLADIDPVKVQIKAERSAVQIPQKSFASVWKNFNYAIKKLDAKSTLDSLKTLVSLSRQLVALKQRIYDREKKISVIIVEAKAQMPAK